MHLILGRYHLERRAGDEPCWVPPTGWRAAIDFRSLPQRTGAVPGGFCLATFDAAPAVRGDVVAVLSDDPDGLLDAQARTALQDAFGIDLTGERAANAVRRLLTRESDPTGLARWKPLMPGSNRRRPIRLGAYRSDAAFDADDPVEWAPVREVLRADLSRLRAPGGGAAGEILAGKVLGGLMLKYRKDDPAEFIRSGDPILVPRDPSTVFTEDFSGTLANWDTIGGMAGGSIVGGAWQADTTGTSNAGIRNTDANDMSADDLYTECDIPAYNESSTLLPGPAARQSGSADEAYWAMWDISGNSDNIVIRRRQSGLTNLATSSATYDSSSGAGLSDVRITADGSDISVTVAGTDSFGVTDTAITGNLKGSLICRTSSASTCDFDNVTISDELSAPITVNLGLAEESDAGLALTIVRTLPLGLAEETDGGFGLTFAKGIDLGLAEEADGGFDLTFLRAVAFGLAEEDDAGLALSLPRIQPLGLAEETDGGFDLTFAKGIDLGLAGETDGGFDLTFLRAITLGLAREGDSALGFANIAAEAGRRLIRLLRRPLTRPITRPWQNPPEDGT